MSYLIGLVMIAFGAFVAYGSRGIAARYFNKNVQKNDIIIKVIGFVILLLGAMMVFGFITF